MAAELMDLLGFRFEMWQIEFYVSTLRELSECSRVEDRVKIMRRMCLAYMFLQRFREDPGFRLHVMEKVYLSEDGRSLRILERLVNELADRVHDASDRSFEMLSKCGTNGGILSDLKPRSLDFQQAN